MPFSRGIISLCTFKNPLGPHLLLLSVYAHKTWFFYAPFLIQNKFKKRFSLRRRGHKVAVFPILLNVIFASIRFKPKMLAKFAIALQFHWTGWTSVAGWSRWPPSMSCASLAQSMWSWLIDRNRVDIASHTIRRVKRCHHSLNKTIQ